MYMCTLHVAILMHISSSLHVTLVESSNWVQFAETKMVGVWGRDCNIVERSAWRVVSAQKVIPLTEVTTVHSRRNTRWIISKRDSFGVVLYRRC